MRRKLQLARAPRLGVTLIEVVAAVVTLGIAIPPVVGLFTAVSTQSAGAALQSVAVGYADALMEEIVSKQFEDPDLAAGSFGTEEGSRAQFDDLDDFDGWSQSPPEQIDGTALDDYAGFTRSVAVENVSTADPDPVSPQSDGSTDLKRIRVTVSWTIGRGGELTLTTLRANL